MEVWEAIEQQRVLTIKGLSPESLRILKGLGALADTLEEVIDGETYCDFDIPTLKELATVFNKKEDDLVDILIELESKDLIDIAGDGGVSLKLIPEGVTL